MEARLDLRHHEPIREQYPLTQLVARFELKQGGKSRTVEKLCGGYLHRESQEKKLSEINSANMKLKRVIEKLSDQGVVPINAEQAFECCSARQD